MATWEKLLLGVLALLVIFWFFPGIKTTMEQSEKSPKDWKGVLIPVALVVLFVFLLIASVRG